MEELLTQASNIQKAQHKMQKTVTAGLDDLERLIKRAKEDVTKDPAHVKQALEWLQKEANEKYCKEVKDTDGKSEAKDEREFFKTQKKFHAAVNKFSKEMDKRFKQDLSVISNPEAFAGKEHLLRRALAIHFIRQGQFDICDVFMKEAGVDEEDELYMTTELLKSEFQKLYSILRELEEGHHLDQAIEWAQAHHDELAKIGSSLEFQLHRLRFAQLLLEQRPMDALAYARQYFGSFSDRHMNEIKRLMTSIIFYRDLKGSPYADLCSPTLWTDIRYQFQRDFCSLLNMSAESPLYASVTVGTTALPVIMKLYKIMSSKKTEWSQQDELPVEIPLSEDLRFHSVFACPVSKEQATENNPPMMMPCGHVICKESLMRLSKSSNSRNSMRFKCPYCPSESSADQALQVYF